MVPLPLLETGEVFLGAVPVLRVGHVRQYVAVAELGRTPAGEPLARQLGASTRQASSVDVREEPRAETLNHLQPLGVVGLVFHGEWIPPGEVRAAFGRAGRLTTAVDVVLGPTDVHDQVLVPLHPGCLGGTVDAWCWFLTSVPRQWRSFAGLPPCSFASPLLV